MARVAFGTSNAVLRLLARQLGDGGMAIIARRHGPDEIEIEDAVPAAALVGRRLPVPAELLTDGPALLAADEVAFAPDWVDGCGSWPSHLHAAPVDGSGMFLIVALCGASPVDPDDFFAAVELLGASFAMGEMTRRERDQSARIMALIEHLPAPVVFVDSRDLQVFLNDEACTLLEIKGDPGRIEVAEALARLVRMSPDRTVQGTLARDPKAHCQFETSAHGRRYRVETRWIDDDALDGRVWLFSDMTAETTARTGLADLAGLLQLTVENVSEGVVLVDSDLRLILWNETIIELFDLPRGLFAERADFTRWLHVMAGRGELGQGDPGAIVAGAIASIRAHESRLDELRMASGRIVDVWRKSLAGGRFILAVRDVTEERQMARLKDELVSTVSHELRTPLTSISGSLGLLRAGIGGVLSDQAAGLVELAWRNGERLARLVNDLLDLDKLGSGEVDFHFAEVDLICLLRETIDQNLPYAQKFGVTFDLDMPVDPVRAKVDADRISQVLSNLLSNAAKFSPVGSSVTTRLETRDGGIRISVIDQGRGIAPDFRRRLFMRFAQEDRATDHEQTGTGLGLAISKMIVEHHGGTIGIDPEVAVGATFHIDLPMAGPRAA